MKVIERIADMKALSRLAAGRGKKVVLVPTMGALHEGHLMLLRKGRELGDVLVVSIFVNPAQFGPGEDYSRYPRDIERDLALARKEGVDVVFSPRAEEMYPGGYQTFVEVEELSRRLCGLSRPGHFRGVATVVVKLFNIVLPRVAVFGLKDYQQQLVIKRLVRDLNMDAEIVTVETVREGDGLAMSSRNRYLGEAERKAAACIPRSMVAAGELFAAGERDVEKLIGRMRGIIDEEPLAAVDYLKICDPVTLDELGEADEGSLVVLAVKIGGTRLIDNCILGRNCVKIRN